MFRLFGRKGNKLQEAAPLIPQPGYLEGRARSDGPPDWLTRLTPEAMLLQPTGMVESANLQDTVVIGCGPAGSSVLSQVATALCARFGGELPPNVRLLQIDVRSVQPGILLLPGGLQPEQHIVLDVPPPEIEQNARDNPTAWQHWEWYVEAVAVGGRARGRGALFYDLRNGSANSAIWSALNRALSRLTSPVVRIVGTTFDDVGSSMLADLAHLCHAVAKAHLEVTLWLAGPVGRPWSARLDAPQQLVRADEQTARTLATLRELERFEQNLQVPFDYVPPINKQSELRALDGDLFKTVFLFEPSAANAAPEDDVLPCMADALLGLMHRGAGRELVQHFALNQVQAGTVKNVSHSGLLSAIGSSTVRLPEQLLTVAMASRLVLDLLGESSVGLLPKLRVTNTGEYEDFEDGERELDTRSTGLRDEAINFVDNFRSAHGALAGPAFLQEAGRRAAGLLNGEHAGDNIKNRRGGLYACQVWLKATASAAARQGETQAMRQLRHLGEQLEVWQAQLEETLIPQAQVRWTTACANLRQLFSQAPTRKWVVGDRLEWPIYQELVRSGSSGNKVEEGSNLYRAAGHFGWELKYESEDGRWVVGLIIPTPGYTYQDRDDGREHLVTCDSASACLDRLFSIAERFVQVRNRGEIVAHQAAALDLQAWFDASAPRIRYDATGASQQLGAVSQLALFLAPTGDLDDELHARLNSTAGQGHLVRVATPEDRSIAVLRILDWVPFANATVYRDQAWLSTPVLLGHYVWRPEQLAAESETGDRRLSPRFLHWLQRDQKLVDLFTRAVLLGLVEQQGGKWRVPGYGSVPAAAVGEALALLAEGNESSEHIRKTKIAQLSEAIDSAEAYLGTTRIGQLRRAKTQLVAELMKGPRSNQDLAIYFTRFA